MATSTFDPVAYKQTTREQWQEAAEAWHRWGPTLEQWLGRATELMLDQAHIGPGARVLDLAAGAGRPDDRRGTSRRPVWERARDRYLARDPRLRRRCGRAAGLANVETREMDGEALDLDDGIFDAVISRVGLIYFPDQQRALREIHRVLRPGGRLSAIVYSTAERNPFFSIPVTIIRRIAGLPAPAPGLPGPFSLGSPGLLETAYANAGFEDVEVRALDAPVRFPTAAECVRFERESFGALHAMLANVTAGRTRPGLARDRDGAPAVRGPRRIRRAPASS